MKKKSAVFRGLAAIMAFILMISVSAVTLTFQDAAIINRALADLGKGVREASAE